jgi:hypothetical protein
MNVVSGESKGRVREVRLKVGWRQAREIRRSCQRCRLSVGDVCHECSVDCVSREGSSELRGPSSARAVLGEFARIDYCIMTLAPDNASAT